MEVLLERYTQVRKEEWNDFVFTKAKNATFLHSRQFFLHNPLNEHDDCSLLFLKNNRIIALIPACEYRLEGKHIFHSHKRSTYGGIIIGNNTTTADMVEVMELFTSFLNQQGFKEAIIRPSFRIYHRNLSDEVDYFLWKYGFAIQYRELEMAIDLSYDLVSQYSDGTWRSIKKSLKQGVTVNANGALEAYWEVLTENLKAKHGASPVHTIQEMNTLISLVGEDKVNLFTAELEGKVIGGILCFITNPITVHAQYIAGDSAYQDYRPVNAVVDYIARWAKEKGYRYFNLGMASEPGGTEINAGLFRFKEGFGARGVLRETLHLNLNN